ncbi:hypothetical protein HDV05_000485, partial [Chytridiales sp. JEL 0842]
MDLQSFERLVALIEDHKVFHNESNNQQAEVWVQLMTTLERLGCHGNGVAIMKVAREMGVGSKHDNAVFQSTELHSRAERFFEDKYYLLGDSAYALSTRMLVPYNGARADERRNAEFNEKISHVRVIVEHTIGVLKARWASLRGIRLKYHVKEDDWEEPIPPRDDDSEAHDGFQ